MNNFNFGKLFALFLFLVALLTFASQCCGHVCVRERQFSFFFLRLDSEAVLI